MISESTEVIKCWRTPKQKFQVVFRSKQRHSIVTQSHATKVKKLKSLLSAALFLTDTAVVVKAQEPMWPGISKVEFEVKDNQGLSCPEPQIVKVHVCTCADGTGLCAIGESSAQTGKGASLGAAAIGALVLGPLLLLRKCAVLMKSPFCKEGVLKGKSYSCSNALDLIALYCDSPCTSL